MSNLITKKNIYLLGILVICLLAFILTPTLAKFDSSFATEEDVVGLTLSFNLGISNIEEYEEVVVDANSYEVFNVNIKNSSSVISYYGIWYKMVTPLEISDDITIARLDGTDTTTSGALEVDAEETVTIIIKNLSNDAVKVNIGVNGSTTSTSDIEYLGGKYLITGTSLEADYYYDNTNSRYVSVKDNTVVFTASTTNFDYTGDVQTFTAPVEGAYKMEAYGASGGGTTAAGTGAYTSGVIYLKNNEQLYVYVGGNGKLADTTATHTSGGYNGGGSAIYSAGTGGGATDIRLLNSSWDNITGLTSRIMVAAGGGGEGAYVPTSTYGGAGGGLAGIDGGDYSTTWSGGGHGGTQVAGGTIGADFTFAETDILGTVGTFALGGIGGGITAYSHGSGAGGAGYYGGAGGSGRNGGGAGGSSYISGYKGAVSVGNSQKIKIQYLPGMINGFDEYGNSILGGSTTVNLQNIDRTLNYIGKSNWDGDAYFHGQIFNLKITLTDGTVVLYYDFAKNSVNDLSGNGYHATLMNGASLVYDGKRYALVLDGVDDYAQVPTLPSSINFASGFTIEVEVIWNSLNNYSRIIDFGNGGPSDNFLLSTYQTTTNIFFNIYNGTEATSIGSGEFIQLNGTNYGKDNEVCETGDSDISCSYHYSGKIFKKANMIAGNASMPTHDGNGTMTGNSGNGYAKISLVVPTIEEEDFTIMLGETLKLSDITCVDNGSGCKVVRISPGDTSTLSVGTHDINIMVIDDYGIVYRYTKSITVEEEEIIIEEVETGEEVDNPVGGTTGE